jgi:hypothetical protein
MEERIKGGLDHVLEIAASGAAGQVTPMWCGDGSHDDGDRLVDDVAACLQDLEITLPPGESVVMRRNQRGQQQQQQPQQAPPKDEEEGDGDDDFALLEETSALCTEPSEGSGSGALSKGYGHWCAQQRARSKIGRERRNSNTAQSPVLASKEDIARTSSAADGFLARFKKEIAMAPEENDFKQGLKLYGEYVAKMGGLKPWEHSRERKPGAFKDPWCDPQPFFTAAFDDIKKCSPLLAWKLAGGVSGTMLEALLATDPFPLLPLLAQ